MLVLLLIGRENGASFLNQFTVIIIHYISTLVDGKRLMNFVINKAGNYEQLWVKYYFNPAKTNVFFVLFFFFESRIGVSRQGCFKVSNSKFWKNELKNKISV